MLTRIHHPHVILKATCLVAIILYAIWIERNRVIFQDLGVDPMRTLKLINLWQKQYIIHNNIMKSNLMKQEGLNQCFHYNYFSNQRAHSLLLNSTCGMKIVQSKCLFFKNGVAIKGGVYYSSMLKTIPKVLVISLRDYLI